MQSLTTQLVVPFIALFFCLLNSLAFAEFNHPGVAYSSQRFHFVRTQIKMQKQPWRDAWQELKSSRYSSLEWQPAPFAHVERGPYGDPDIGASEFSRDSRAAHHHALCWAITGDEKHARKVAEILNAWSQKLISVRNHDAKLLIGMSGYGYVVSAEILKHTWNKWPKGDQQRFEAMLRNVWFPIIKDFYPSANGNWDASMMQVMIAMGIFLDDQKMFDRAVDYYRHGKGNGAIGNYFKKTGQCQETGRDQAHTQMGLEFLANTCESAWIQGVDLYGELDNRLLAGFEYTAKYNLGYEVPYEPYLSFEGRYHYKKISDDSRGKLRPMYEKVLNHFSNRKSLKAPFTNQAALKLRTPSGKLNPKSGKTSERNRARNHFPNKSYLDTLMFGGTPQMKTTQPSK